MPSPSHSWRPIEGELNRSTVLELFFDLAFVLVLTKLSNHLASHLTWRGLFETAVLTIATWWVWTMVTWITDLYSSTEARLQLLITVLTFGVIAMAVAIPEAFGAHGLIFAGAYVGVHLIRNIALLIARREKAMWRHPLRMAVWTLTTAPLWFIGGVLHDTRQLVLWAVAVAIDCTCATAGWPVPLLGRLRPEEWHATGEHLAERYRQILLIGTGDAILTMGAAWIDTPTTPLRGTMLALAFLYTALLWQTYFRVAGERLAELIARSTNKTHATQLSVDYHLLMLLGIVISAVGIDIVIRHPLGHTRGFWVAVIIVGPAVFMLGRVLFGRLVLGRLSPSRVITLIALLVITPVAGVVPPFVNAVLVTAILSFVQAPMISNRIAQWLHEPVLEER